MQINMSADQDRSGFSKSKNFADKARIGSDCFGSDQDLKKGRSAHLLQPSSTVDKVIVIVLKLGIPSKLFVDLI